MTDPSASKVSVCIPVYNGSDYIADSIQSVLAQTYKNFNLIVCDNGSTDNTEEIVRNVKDSRLTYVRNNKNLGLVGNHNRCLELADGEYVYFLHHDDIMLPDNLALKVSILDEHPKVGLVHSDVLFIDKAGQHLDLSKFDAKRDYIEDGIKVFEKYILVQSYRSLLHQFQENLHRIQDLGVQMLQLFRGESLDFYLVKLKSSSYSISWRASFS